MDSEATDATKRGTGPFIGRDEELALLASLFERSVRESRPYLVTVFGEAGVGKSRLLSELAESLEERVDQVETLVGHSPAYGTSTTYAALGEILRERFGVSRAEASSVGAHKLAAGIEELAEGTGELVDATRAAALIARVAGIDEPGEAEDEDPEQVRDQIFAATRLVLQLLSARRPIVVAFEDVHWADEGLLDLIEHLAGWGHGPVLILCLARDELLERRPAWGGGRRNATTLSLDPLAAEEAESLVESLLAGQPSGGELAAEGGRSLRRQPAVCRGDGQPAPRGAKRRRRGATRQRSCGTCGTSRRARIRRAAVAAGSLGRRAELLGQGRRGPGRRVGRGLAGRARRQGHDRPHSRRAASPASASSRSSTRSFAMWPTARCHAPSAPAGTPSSRTSSRVASGRTEAASPPFLQSIG